MRSIKRRLVVVAILAAAGAGVPGCTMSETGQRTVSGGLIGAGGGALLGAIGGNAGLGAAVGAGAGILGGFLYDQHKKATAR